MTPRTLHFSERAAEGIERGALALRGLGLRSSHHIAPGSALPKVNWRSVPVFKFLSPVAIAKPICRFFSIIAGRSSLFCDQSIGNGAKTVGKIIITEFVSLDGVAEAPEKWSLSFWNKETELFKTEELAAHSAMLLGRITYEGFAAAWPSRTGDFADRFNSLPKYVASNTLKNLAWQGAELLAPGLAESVLAVKKKTVGNIYVHGSIALSQALIAVNLVDEIHMLSYPLILGSGRKLLENIPQVALNLIGSQCFGNGVIAHKYGVKPN